MNEWTGEHFETNLSPAGHTPQQIRRLVCDRVMLHVEKRLSLDQYRSFRTSARANAWVDYMARQIVVALTMEMPGILQERLVVHRSWPATWWDAFKLRWFPLWMRRRWPVIYETLDIDRPVYLAVCTHLSVPPGPHLSFLYAAQQAVEQQHPTIDPGKFLDLWEENRVLAAAVEELKHRCKMIRKFVEAEVAARGSLPPSDDEVEDER